MLVDPETNGAVDGTRFDLSAEYMIDYCRGLEADEQAAHPEPTQHSAIEDVRREEPTRINFKVEDVQREGRLKIIVGGRQ
jgi:hypothetical protein